MVIILAIIIGIGSVYFYGEDNPIEEKAEQVIENETGIDIDLTPSSPENK
jgi:hypothetical protein